MEMEEGYEMTRGEEEERGGCWTPKRSCGGCPVAALCPPPPPRKKRCWYGKKGKREPPKNGYFQPPDDLELIFSVPARHQSCA